jgi:hypothetical protein
MATTTANKITTGTRGAQRQSLDRDSNYEVDSHMYPSDLMADARYGGNYVLFFINVAEESQLAKGGVPFVNPEAVPDRNVGDFRGKAFTKTQLVVAGTAAGAVAGTALGAIFGVGGTGGPVGAGLGAAGNAIIPGPEDGKLTRPQKRLKTAIALYMPNQLNIRYGMQYEEESFAGAQMAVKGLNAAMQAVNLAEGAQKASSTVREILAAGAISSGAVPFAGATAFGAGVAPNPKKEQVFKGVDFRSFQFNYQFFPRSEEEAKNVLEIVHALKYHMHPEFKSGDGFLYIYPSEFDIVYYNGDKANDNVHRHTSCVLKDMSVNYTPQGQFNTFANGMPAQINVDMTFLELALLTKEDIDKGL